MANKYIDRTIHCYDANGKQVKVEISVVDDYFKLYFNAQHLLIQLNALQRCFYDFLCEKMDDRNRVFIDISFKNEFIIHYNKIRGSKNSIVINSIDSYVSKLKNIGLTINEDTRGYYIVNPRYAYKKSQQMRADLIKQIIQFRVTNGLSIKQLINEPETKAITVHTSE